MSTELQTTVSFLGSGMIAEAWLVRLITSGSVPPDRIMICDPRRERIAELVSRFGVRAGSTNIEGARFGQTIVLAPPPPETLPVLREVAGARTADKLIVSLAAALPVARLQQEARPSVAVRIMPNTPGEVGEAMNLVAFGDAFPKERKPEVEKLLTLLGRSFEVDDAQMDLWCALCAVGPTYIFPVIDALASVAAAKGLPADQVLQAAAQVVAGAARMAQESGKSIAQLNGMIGIHTLDELAASALFTAAYEQALAKLQGLSKKMAASA